MDYFKSLDNRHELESKRKYLESPWNYLIEQGKDQGIATQRNFIQ